MAETETMNDTKAREGDEAEALRGVPSETALRLMKDMLLFRRFEEKAEEAYAIGKIGGFCHLHIGQEAVAAGTIAPLEERDLVISAYREHTQALAKGMDPRVVMSELFGRADGCSGGKGGSMHLFDAARGFLGGHGIVGAQVPLAAGMAFTSKYRDEERVVLCFLGDAAVNQGAFHEALNMSAVWSLPVIYAVENNEYGMGTAFKRVSTVEIRDKACAYGIESSVVNGQDVLETYTHFEALAAEVREGGGPRYVDVRTYRFKGHSMSDPVSGTYRSKEEVQGRVEREDPIAILREILFEAELLDQEGLEEMDGEARARAQDAFDFADASPVPAASALYEHVYADTTPNGRFFLDGRERPDEEDA